jgi:hypothetical protein
MRKHAPDQTCEVPPERGDAAGSSDLPGEWQPVQALIHRRFWEFTGKNIALGPWGTIWLMIVTPLFLIQNTGAYVVALYAAPPVLVAEVAHTCQR